MTGGDGPEATVEESIRLGRIAGVRIGMNWSLLVVVWLIAWSLARATLPDSAPGYGLGAYWVAGTAAAVVFLASILAHELGHATVARRDGVGVEGITLWLFGGVARLTSRARSADSELRIAVAGPAVSIALGGAFLGASVALDAADVAPLTVATLRWLGTINLTLAVFNLIPAAPLDGGRVLAAILWRRSGDETGARVRATQAGVAFGRVLVVLGLAAFAFGGGLGGLWLVFLGWFLISAARAEQMDVVVHHSLAGVRVGDVMTPDPEVAPFMGTVAAFVTDVVDHSRHSAFPLVDLSGRVVALVTLHRLRTVPPAERAHVALSEVATPIEQVVVCAPEEELAAVLPRLMGNDRRALVMVEGRLVGIVSPSDVARALDRASLVRGVDLPA